MVVEPPTYLTAADNPGAVDAAVESWRRYNPRVRVQRTTRLLQVYAGQITLHVAVGWVDEPAHHDVPPRGAA